LETRVEDRTAELERANERLEQQTHRLRALRELDQTILAAESPREIATETLRHTRQIIPFHRASVSVIEWDADRARVLATRQEEEFMGGGTTIPLDDFYLTDALRAGETEVIPDLAAQPRSGTAARVQNIGIRSVLCLPMMVEGTLIGLFKIGRTRPDAFEAEDRQVGSQLADHLAIALRQSQLLEKVQAQRERLEERVQERTAELESFTYSVSHDLRTPLRAIDGYTRILKEDHADQLDDEGRRLLNVVYDSAQTMGDLIDDLLTLSRLGRRDLTRAPTNMEALVHDTVGELRRAHPEIAADAFVLSPLPNAQADRSMIRHVLTNLLSNALKFTRPVDAPQIEVRGERQAKRCVYGVVDNGVGFDPNQADELFGVFQRGHADDEFEGTGVGLAVVDRIVRRHGGETWADGAKGDGASFFFTLPPAEAGRA
jgi:signal transduction histidine kinase